jgi:lipopolysaccharide export system protein LptC
VSHPGTWATLLALAVLAAFTWWLQEATQAPAAVNASIGHVPDYTVEDFSLTTMNLQGKPYYRLRAPAMARYADDHTAEVQKPELEFREEKGPPWELVAERAWISADGSVVRLLGEVVITRKQAPGYDAVKAITSDVTIEPQRRYATTEREVRAWLGPHQVQAEGMKLYLPDQRLDLLSKVRARYVVGP